MRKVPYQVVERILLDIPKSKMRPEFSTNKHTVFVVDHVIIKIPKDGCDMIHLMDILQDQLGMDWWMVDYIFGQNNLRP